MPRPSNRINATSNKGRKLLAKIHKMEDYALTVVDDEGNMPTRKQFYDKACKLGLDGELIGKLLACFYGKYGKYLSYDESYKEMRKLEEELFVFPANNNA